MIFSGSSSEMIAMTIREPLVRRASSDLAKDEVMCIGSGEESGTEDSEANIRFNKESVSSCMQFVPYGGTVGTAGMAGEPPTTEGTASSIMMAKTSRWEQRLAKRA